MNPLQRAVPTPQVEIVVDRAFRRQVLRQCAPLAPGRQGVEDAVQHLAHIDRALAPAALGGRDQRRDQGPFRIAQIARIAQALAARGKTMFLRPHVVLPPPNRTTYRITTDSTNSTSFRSGS